MFEEILIDDRNAQPVVEILADTQLWKIPSTLSNGFRDVGNYIEKSGAERVGMPFARYLDIDWQSMRNRGGFGQFLDLLTKMQKMRIGLPIAQVPEGSDKGGLEDGIEVGEIAAGRYVTTFHRGAYHKVDSTYRKIVDWAEAENVLLADSSIECYIDDPSEMETAQVRTQIFIAVD